MADDETVEIVEEPGAFLDAPNQQVVRADGSAPWEEGAGGAAGDPETQVVDETEPRPQQQEGGPNLDAMTKDELLAYGQQLGISPMNAAMNKDEIRTSIDQYRAGGG